MLTLTVQPNRIGPILGRHPWVFSRAIVNIPNNIPVGEVIKLVDGQNNFLAQGYFSSYSQITVRLWGWNKDEEVNDKFFEKRVALAYELRQKYVESKNTNSFRLIASENDLLPGLTVDKYAEYLVVQFHNRGINAWREPIINALKKIIKPKGIYERSDVGGREKESKQIEIAGRGERPLAPTIEESPLLYGKVPPRIKIKENGYQFWVDVIGGQKTGFFLDQRDKRQALQKYVKGKIVLNCFSYTGGFSVYALGAGAKKVVSVDVSEPALELAEENVKLNKLNEKKCEFICGDVKRFLGDMVNETLPRAPLLPGEGVGDSFSRREKARMRGGSPYDVIILDPPAFIKDRSKMQEGFSGYRRLNEMALRVLPPNSILVTASCSIHLSLQDFRYMLNQAAGRAGREVQILETYTHGIDHPELAAFTEGEYLKCIFARVL